MRTKRIDASINHSGRDLNFIRCKRRRPVGCGIYQLMTLRQVYNSPLKAQKNQHVGDLFGAVSEENVARIKRQNKKKISVVIGNPPYNANQLNENENNKNREYPEIDRRIKSTYIAASTARKTKLYDMYVRFFRWASNYKHLAVVAIGI